MSLRLYNTLTRQTEDFETLEPGKVSMYVCGPTVYANAHIGHAMAAIVFDMVRRYLIFRGYQVSYATNFTDVDDKIIRRANETGQDPMQMANLFAAGISAPPGRSQCHAGRYLSQSQRDHPADH